MLRWRVLVALARVRRVVPVRHVRQVLAVGMVLEPKLRLVRRALLAQLAVPPARVAVPLALRKRAVLVVRPVLLWPVRSRVAALVLVSPMSRRVWPPGLVLWAALS